MAGGGQPRVTSRGNWWLYSGFSYSCIGRTELRNRNLRAKEGTANRAIFGARPSQRRARLRLKSTDGRGCTKERKSHLASGPYEANS
ncbi:hypothetical protein KM043_013836 [Ampulex compressa]|nr:hypothetical protein KM043_013836 [Ampulex compressa]